MSEAATNSLRAFPCRQCGAKVEFAPGTSSLRCPYCEAENEIPDEGAVVAEEDFFATLASLEEAAAHEDVRVLRCQGCGAETSVAGTTTSLSCAFCGSNIVSQMESQSRVRPMGVLPFGVAREAAVGAFRTWISSRWFAPNALKRQSLIDEQLSGVYLPCWTFDTKATTEYRGQRGDAYYVTVGSGNNRRTERRMRWTSASGRVRNHFDDLLVLASRSLPERLTHSLEPWDTKAVKPYADEYLAGFRAECYTIDLKSGWGLALRLMEPAIDGTIRADIGGDSQRISWKHTTHRETTFKYVLLPVWVSAYRYKGKVYRFLVNARTGEVQGDRPYSAWKIALAIIAGLLILGAIAFFVLGSR
ncbi:MAG: hypothetical protein SFY69_05855 [Planctomycetota bacterium]|nr:hypothetical protein [Planctomycetota bacterium]